MIQKITIPIICSLLFLLTSSFQSLAHQKELDLDRKIKLNVQNVSVKSALNELAKIANLRLVMRDDYFNSNQEKVSLQADQISISQAFIRILNNTGLTYRVLENYIAIVSNKNQQFFQGVVVDANTGNPLKGVTVRLKGVSSGGSITNSDGRFLFRFQLKKQKSFFLLLVIGRKHNLLKLGFPHRSNL